MQERLGHTNIATTLDLYSHVPSEMQRHAADALEAKITEVRSKLGRVTCGEMGHPLTVRNAW